MAPKKNYPQEQMRLAIEAVHKGEKISTAATNFGVPRVTLHNKITGKSPVDCAMGPSTVLTNDDETILEKWILAMLEKHIPITKEELLDSVQRIVTDRKQQTPFTNNRPGEKWYSLFMKRHPILTERIAQNLTTARDNVTVKDIQGWFAEVGEYLKDKELLEVLQKPERIFNTDESAFFLSPKPGKVLSKRGEKHVYSSSGDEKENLTVLVTGNAAGNLAPPMVVYDYERIPAAVSSCFPEKWAIGRSQSGWMCGSTFFEYIANVFNPWLEQQGIDKPVLFFLDGHKSHLTMHLSNFCVENGIEIIALNPNSTHIMQPMDLSVFRPLKSSWRKAVNAWKMKNPGKTLKKPQFAPVLEGALNTINPETIQNGFRAAGLCPFGPEYVDTSKIKTKNEKREEADQTRERDFLKMLELAMVKTFSVGKLQLFNNLYLESRTRLEELLPQEDQSLFLIWATTKQSLTVIPDAVTEIETEEEALTDDPVSGAAPKNMNINGIETEIIRSQSKEPGFEINTNRETLTDGLAKPENQNNKETEKEIRRQTKEPIPEIETEKKALTDDPVSGAAPKNMNINGIETEIIRSQSKEPGFEINTNRETLTDGLAKPENQNNKETEKEIRRQTKEPIPEIETEKKALTDDPVSGAAPKNININGIETEIIRSQLKEPGLKIKTNRETLIDGQAKPEDQEKKETEKEIRRQTKEPIPEIETEEEALTDDPFSGAAPKNTNIKGIEPEIIRSKSKEPGLEIKTNRNTLTDGLAKPEKQKPKETEKENRRQMKKPVPEIETEEEALTDDPISRAAPENLKTYGTEAEIIRSQSKKLRFEANTNKEVLTDGTNKPTNQKTNQTEKTIIRKQSKEPGLVEMDKEALTDLIHITEKKDLNTTTHQPKSKITILSNILLSQKTPTKEPTPSTSKSGSISELFIPSPFKRNLFWPDEFETKNSKKRRLKEKIPSAITSTAWRQYNEKKEAEKILKQEEKEKRAIERQEKKILKERLLEEQKKKKKNKKIRIKHVDSDVTSTDTETEVKYAESDDSCWLEETNNDEYETPNKREKKSISMQTKKVTDTNSDNIPPSRIVSKRSNLTPGNYVIVVYEGQHFPGVVKTVAEDGAEISTMAFSTGDSFKWPDKPDTIWYRKIDILEHIKPPVLINKRGFYYIKEMKKYLPFTA